MQNRQTMMCLKVSVGVINGTVKIANFVITEEPVQLHDPNPLPPPPPSGLLETVSADVLTFSYQDLVEGTENFSSQYIIGNGGFGIVYKASIRNHGPFAIKKIHKVLNSCV